MGASIVLAMSEIEPSLSAPGNGGPPPQPPGPVPEGFAPPQRARTEAAPVPPTPRHPEVPIGPPASAVGGPFLDTPSVPPQSKKQAWKWFLFALSGFLVGQIAAAVFGEVAGMIAGKNSAQMSAIVRAAIPPEWYVLSTLLGLWIGFIGAPWLASRTQGTRRFFSDMGLRFRWIDLVGIGIGVAGQYAIGLLYEPFKHDIHNFNQTFNAPSQKLTGASHGGGFLVIALATVVFVPFMEELFFRGLLLKAIVRLCTPTSAGAGRARGAGVLLAVIVDGLVFGLAHGEWIQLPGLALFGMVLAAVSYRTGRLGMNMVAHGTFNLVAVLSILQSGGGVLH